MDNSVDAVPVDGADGAELQPRAVRAVEIEEVLASGGTADRGADAVASLEEDGDDPGAQEEEGEGGGGGGGEGRLRCGCEIVIILMMCVWLVVCVCVFFFPPSKKIAREEWQ